MKFDFFEDGSGSEEEKRNAATYVKKKKATRADKERQKKVNDWVKTINSTFQEIDDYDLLIE